MVEESQTTPEETQPTVQPTEVKPVEKNTVVPPTETSKPNLPLDMDKINAVFEEKLKVIQAQYEENLNKKTEEINNSYSEKISAFEEKLSTMEGRKGIVPQERIPTTPTEPVNEPKPVTYEDLKNLNMSPVEEHEAAQVFLESLRK